MLPDRFREEEVWGERQAGMHHPDSVQREPTGGSNERACPKCNVMLMVHVRGKCPVVGNRKDAA